MGLVSYLVPVYVTVRKELDINKKTSCDVRRSTDLFGRRFRKCRHIRIPPHSALQRFAQYEQMAPRTSPARS